MISKSRVYDGRDNKPVQRWVHVMSGDGPRWAIPRMRAANAQLILHSGNVEGRTGCQGQSDKEEKQPMVDVECTMYENPVSVAKIMMTVATALARTNADNVLNAGEWGRFGSHMVGTLYAVELKQRDVDKPNAVKLMSR
jgi:hypothetical protein